jgi:hypothetical protein
MKLGGLLCVARGHEARRPRFRVRGIPPPCFLQEYDSIGVNAWWCAKDVILKGIVATCLKGRGETLSRNAYPLVHVSS